MRNSPPRFAQRFFSWYCRNHLHDSILGDLEEQFYQNQDKYGTRRAQLIYCLGVIQFINRFTLKPAPYASSSNFYSRTMIKNNIISSLRFLARNKGFTFINIFGLTLGFSSFLLILFFVNHERSFDQFHENKEQVYRINNSFQDNAGNVTTLVNSAPALAPGIRGKFPELQKVSRLRYAMNCLFSNEGIQFYEEKGYYADSIFLEILQYEMLYGDPDKALDQPNSIVLTEALAIKYFNTSNPVGSTLLFNNTTPLKVTGVLASLPKNSHLNFEFLLSFSTYQIPEGYASDLTSWWWLGFLTYVELKPNANSKNFEQKLVQLYKDLNPDNPNPIRPKVQSLQDIYLKSNGMSDDLASPIRMGNQTNVKVLLMVAVLILIIAGFNFSNLTHALSFNRSKAAGIRKVLGADRKSIIIQLLTESLLLTFFCLILAFGIVFLFLPFISQFMKWELVLGFRALLKMLPTLIVTGVIIGIFSSFYPALSLARIDIIKSLKGPLKIIRRHPLQLKDVLLMVQFAISIGLICATIVMTKQIEYLRNADTGYDTENVILIKMLPEDMSLYFELYKERLTQNAAVKSVSRSERIVGDPWPFSVILKVDDDPETSKRIFFNQIDYDYFETMGVSLSSGRFFSKEFVNDSSKAIIINQKAVELMALENPIGQQVHFFDQDGPRTIVGVVEDFNYTSLHESIGPAAVVLPFIDLEYMYVRFAPGAIKAQTTLLEDTWTQVAQGIPLEWHFLDENVDRLYRSEEKLSSMIQALSLIAILLACLGLYGIVAFMINNRIKEVGVRKILGASVQSLYTLFIKKYVVQIFLAMLLILPLMHYLMNTWLKDFAYRISISWWVYPLATLLLIILILLTVTSQVLKAARVNPTNLLRQD